MRLRQTAVGGAVHDQRLAETIESLRLAFSDIDGLFASIDKVEPALARVGSGRNQAPAGAFLSSPTSLGVYEQATLGSTAEVNANTTSYSNREPVFTTTSTSAILVGGTYDGASGDDTLTISVVRGGIVESGGSPSIKLRVQDSGGQIANIDVDQAAAAYTPVAIGNGLTLSFSAGDIVKDDEFSFGVSSTTPSAVDPDAAFNGFGNASPGFEEAFTVSAGSFDINGQSVSVFNNDTINSVIGRINGLDFGVAASFDAGTETVQLSNEGDTAQVVLGADSSGFFNATKLSGATHQVTSVNEQTRTMEDVTDLSGVSAGSILVDGQSVSIDPALDSAADIAARITSDVAGVTANIVDGRLSLFSATSFDVQDNGTGFFGSLGVADQTVEATVGRPTSDKGHRRRVALRLGEVSEQINEIFENLGKLPMSDNVRNGLREELLASMRDLFGDQDATEFRASFGMTISFDQNQPLVSYDSRDAQRLTTDLSREANALEKFLVGSNGESGLMGAFGDFFDSAQRSVASLAGGLGMRVDLNA